MHTKKISTKLLIRFSGIFLVLFGLIVGALSLSFRHLSISSARDNAISLAKTIRDGITSLMYLGVIQNREIYLERVMETQGHGGIKKLKVIRGEKVIRQFGQPREHEKPETDLEFEVLKTGVLAERITEFTEHPIYELVIPYRATSKGRVNCLSCHQANEGDVLGAISINFDLSNQRSIGVNIILLISLLAIVAILLIFWVSHHFFQPYGRFFDALIHGFEELEKGHLHNYIENDLDDEAGVVTEKFNKMQKTLSGIFNDISNKVFFLVGYELYKSGHAIQDTTHNVDQLIRLYHFKKKIEKDTNNFEIFKRLQKTFLDMGLDNFAIYELDSRQKKFRLITDYAIHHSRSNDDQIYLDDTPKFKTDAISIPHCHKAIGKNPRQCPVIKENEAYYSDHEGRCCPFLNFQESYPIGHICLPVFGANQTVIGQFVYDQDRTETVNRLTPVVKSYIQESMHVLEVNNAMSFIRDQSLSDELTGLYNRRYLEEVSSQFLEVNLKKGVPLGFLMIDLDFFKRVNDDLGHDAGDMVLKKISQTIKDVVRESDVVIRFGGEEMLVLANNIVPGTAKDLGEKVRKAVEDMNFVYAKKEFKKTTSIGVAEFPRDSQHFWICIKNADSALYEAKGTGRNKVVEFVEGMEKGDD
ncbi:MAG: diguanylate cyclase [SAR324 cluster bacterium]|nr:diguanylate cyclase [SAR324 cluster bacterium]